MLISDVFLAVRPIASRTPLCRMDCIIGSELTLPIYIRTLLALNCESFQLFIQLIYFKLF